MQPYKTVPTLYQQCTNRQNSQTAKMTIGVSYNRHMSTQSPLNTQSARTRPRLANTQSHKIRVYTRIQDRYVYRPMFNTYGPIVPQY